MKAMYYFTFTLGDEERCDKYCIVEGEGLEEGDCYIKAREIFCQKYGTKWAFQYDSKEWGKGEESHPIKYDLKVLDMYTQELGWMR